MQAIMQEHAVRRPRRWELLRAGFSNWQVPAVLAFIDYRSNQVWPGRLTAVGDMRCDLRARSGGTRLVARVRDVNAPAEVFGRNEYDQAGIDWSAVEYVLDLGGHVGSFTLWAAARTRARFFAVEPNPFVYELLRGNVRRAGLDDRVTLRQAAVGDAPGRSWFELDKDSAASRLRGNQPDGSGLEVEVITLEQAVAGSGFPRIDVVKMDIEGAEYGVLASADGALLGSVRHWIVECHPGYAEGSPTSVAERLSEAGLTPSVAAKPDQLALVTASRLGG
jgi:FkbM family methyltransferase